MKPTNQQIVFLEIELKFCSYFLYAFCILFLQFILILFIAFYKITTLMRIGRSDGNLVCIFLVVYPYPPVGKNVPQSENF